MMFNKILYWDRYPMDTGLPFIIYIIVDVSYKVVPPVDSVQLVNITPISLGLMVDISNQLMGL